MLFAKTGLSVIPEAKCATCFKAPPPRPCDCFITFSKIQLQNPYENEYSVLSHQIELQLVRGLKSLHFLQIFQSGLNKRLYCITFQKSYFLIVKFIFVLFFFDDHQYSYVCRQCYTAYINKILRHLGQKLMQYSRTEKLFRSVYLILVSTRFKQFDKIWIFWLNSKQ